MTPIVDLHSHTTASDGLLTPAQLLDEAVRRGVAVLAITDHDTLDGVKVAISDARARALPLRLVPGIEISCFVDETEIHVLGLGLKPETAGLDAWLRELMDQRVDRLRRMAEVLMRHGIQIDLSEVLTPQKIGSVGRPHIARLLIAGGHAKDIDDAFRKWLSPGRPAHVDRLRVPAQEAIRRIHEAGGIAIQAHPGQMGKDADIPRLIGWGLDGLEVHHPDHTRAMRKRYAKMVADSGLLGSGGSDFHSKSDHHGASVGSSATTLENWQRIEPRLAAA